MKIKSLGTCEQFYSILVTCVSQTLVIIWKGICGEWGGAESRGNGARPVE